MADCETMLYQWTEKRWKAFFRKHAETEVFDISSVSVHDENIGAVRYRRVVLLDEKDVVKFKITFELSDDGCSVSAEEASNNGNLVCERVVASGDYTSNRIVSFFRMAIDKLYAKKL